MMLESRPGGNRLISLVDAMLIIGGLCWLIVSLVHAVGSRRRA
jgi:hypothetical protein